MSRRLRPFSGSKLTSRITAVAVATATAITLAGTTAGPAQSAPDDQCPEAFPVSDLAAGQPVTGLTVSTGTTPEGFTGSVLGVLNDGIMPGLDMIMVRLTSSEIDRVGGIWAGMSGSPVYAEDGSLIGAVSYGLAIGPSPVAGVTPAADMQEMLTGSSADRIRSATKVAIPERVANRIVRRGDATSDEVDSGMAQLRLPFGITGLGSQKRFNQVKKRLHLDGMKVMRAGTAAADDDAVNEMVAGGNMAASVSYGDITAAGVGTVTAVCGTEVLGFGHPMQWTGPATLSLHGADAVYVQEDPAYAGFKVANLGAPVGTVNQDRMPGIVGVEGALPATSDVTSTVTSGTRSRDGVTHISLPEAVPDLAFSHLLSNEDRIFDGIGKGTADLGWTIHGTREDGSPFSLHRSDLFASEYDITYESAADLSDALYTLEYNGVEDIEITDVDADSNLSRDYDHYTITRVEMRGKGSWEKVNRHRNLRLQAGSTKQFRVTMHSADSGPRKVILEVPVPRRTAGRSGSLEIFGGSGGSSDYYYYGDEGFSSAKKAKADEPGFEDVLKSLRRQPHNDEVVADLTFYNNHGNVMKHRRDKSSTGLVVDGGISVGVRSVG